MILKFISKAFLYLGIPYLLIHFLGNGWGISAIIIYAMLLLWADFGMTFELWIVSINKNMTLYAVFGYFFYLCYLFYTDKNSVTVGHIFFMTVLFYQLSSKNLEQLKSEKDKEIEELKRRIFEMRKENLNNRNTDNF